MSWSTAATLSAIFAVGLTLRLMYLHQPMAYDEAYSFLNFARRSWIEGIADYNNTNNHILNTLLMHTCYRIWGQQDWACGWLRRECSPLLPYPPRRWSAREAGSPPPCSGVPPVYSACRGYTMVVLDALVVVVLADPAGAASFSWHGAAWLALSSTAVIH